MLQETPDSGGEIFTWVLSVQLSMRSNAREIDIFLALSCQQYRQKINVSYGTFQTNLLSTGKDILFVFRKFAHQVVDHAGAHSNHDGDEDEDDDNVLGLGEVNGDATTLSRTASLLIPTKLAVANSVAQEALIWVKRVADRLMIRWCSRMVLLVTYTKCIITVVKAIFTLLFPFILKFVLVHRTLNLSDPLPWKRDREVLFSVLHLLCEHREPRCKFWTNALCLSKVPAVKEYQKDDSYLGYLGFKSCSQVHLGFWLTLHTKCWLLLSLIPRLIHKR